MGLIVKEAMQHRGITVEVSGALANVLVKYAELLASQGYLTAAYTYLGESQEVFYVLSFVNRHFCFMPLI